jgi:hypothetical protein
VCGLRSKDRRAGQVHDHVEVVNPCLDSEGADQLTGGQHVARRLDVVLDHCGGSRVDYSCAVSGTPAKLIDLQGHSRGHGAKRRPFTAPTSSGRQSCQYVTAARSVGLRSATEPRCASHRQWKVRSRTDQPAQPVGNQERSSSIVVTTARRSGMHP